MKKELISYVERQAEKAENLSFCSGIKLLHIRNSVEELLSLIGRGGIFEEYTLHNIEHIEEMLKIVEWLVPDGTKEEMTYAEWLMLTLAVYFHDLGMLVTKDEYENRDGSDYSISGQLKVHSTNKQVNFLVFKGNLSAGNYFSYG